MNRCRRVARCCATWRVRPCPKSSAWYASKPPTRLAPMPESCSRATLAVQGGRPHGEPGTPVATPLVQSVNFLTEPGSREELLYTRHGNTPNAVTLQKRLAMLEGSEAALVLGSGMGATACTMLALLRAGDHLLASSWLYGGSRHLFEQELVSQGIEVTFVDPTETRGWRRSRAAQHARVVSRVAGQSNHSRA